MCGCGRTNGTHPREMDKVHEETVEVCLEAHVQDLVKVRVVDVRKHAEHLLVDGLARLLKQLREAALLADPAFARRRAAGHGLARNHGRWRGLRGRRGAAGLGGEEGLVVEPVRDPLQHVLDVRGRGQAHGLLVGIEPSVVEPDFVRGKKIIGKKTQKTQKTTKNKIQK